MRFRAADNLVPSTWPVVTGSCPLMPMLKRSLIHHTGRIVEVESTTLWSHFSSYNISKTDGKCIEGSTLEDTTVIFFQATPSGWTEIKAIKMRPLTIRSQVSGHIVSESGIATDPKKIESITKWPEPTNLTEIRTFPAFSRYSLNIFMKSKIHKSQQCPLSNIPDSSQAVLSSAPKKEGTPLPSSAPKTEDVGQAGISV